MSQNYYPRSHSNRSKIWVYFKKCDDDPEKVRCNLCSMKLCNKGTTTTALWNHVKFKHSIDKHHYSSKTSYNNNNSLFDQEHLLESSSELIMTPTKLKYNNNKHLNLNSKNVNNLDNNNLGFIDYNDLNVTSMKPLPSSSLSKNLISRLNQFSSPVTRKLKFWNKKSFQVNQYDPSFKVIYLGNLGMQLWSKDESCLDKPLSTLWNNYLVNMKTEIVMRLTICNSGLKAITRQHGLTQYWSNRLVFCCSHKNYPRIFSWVYRHEGKKMRQELRCHAVFCPSPEKASKMALLLNQRIACALQEFKREKKSRGGINLVNTISSSLLQKLPRTIPLRRQILAKGTSNFRPPLERSKSAPKLTSIQEEEYDLDECQVSQEEFEFEESFGDKDDSESDDIDGEEKKHDNDDEEDNSQNIESNSFTTTTANEETSNSSVCATGDSSYDIKHGHNDTSTVNIMLNNLPVAPSDIDRKSDSILEDGLIECKEEEEKEEEKTINQSSSIRRLMNSHTNQKLSANTIDKSSSLDKQLVVDKEKDTRTEINNSLLLIHGAKNNNNTTSTTSTTASISSSNINNNNNRDSQSSDQAYESPTQEIILSWSNLVIK